MIGILDRSHTWLECWTGTTHQWNIGQESHMIGILDRSHTWLEYWTGVTHNWNIGQEPHMIGISDRIHTYNGQKWLKMKNAKSQLKVIKSKSWRVRTPPKLTNPLLIGLTRAHLVIRLRFYGSFKIFSFIAFQFHCFSVYPIFQISDFSFSTFYFSCFQFLSFSVSLRFSSSVFQFLCFQFLWIKVWHVLVLFGTFSNISNICRVQAVQASDFSFQVFCSPVFIFLRF